MSAYSIFTYVPGELPEAYRNFILSRWLRTLRRGNDYYRLIDPKAYFESYEAYLKRLISSASASVAVLEDEHDVILGFAIYRQATLDYVFVLPHSRNHRIASALVPQDIETISHLTSLGLIIWSNKRPQWRFNPFS